MSLKIGFSELIEYQRTWFKFLLCDTEIQPRHSALLESCFEVHFSLIAL